MNKDWKRIKTLTVFRWHILYIDNHKDTTRKLLEPISECSIVSGYKVNADKFLVFPYTNNTKS